MKNYLLFAPNNNIAKIAEELNQNASDYHLDIYTTVEKESVIQKAASLSPNQYDLIIARGLIVNYIKSATTLPVVSMRMTSQEMISLIHQAIQMVHSDHPKIAIIGSRELFPDISKLSELFCTTITLFYISSPDEVRACVDRACQNQYDIILGGLSMCQYAASVGIPHLNLSGSEDSLLEALRIAKQISYAADIEKKNRAEITVLLDYSINGIIRLDHKGLITGMNRIAREMLHYPAELISQRHISSLTPNITSTLLHQVIDLGMSIHSLFLNINNHDFLCNFIPLTINHISDGAILSLQEVKTILNASSIVKRDIHQKNLKASASFQTLLCESRTMQEVVREAKILSLSNSPVFIYGENGTERELLAECIHMESKRCDGPFVPINCKCYPPADQRKILLGFLSNEEQAESISPFSMANTGTLLLQNISSLSTENQEFLLYYLTTGNILNQSVNRLYTYDARIITTSDTSLQEEYEKGAFIPELYYLLTSMSLFIPPLRSRKEDINTYVDYFIRHYSSLYSRLNTLSAGAKELLTNYPWPGNLPQLTHFCERLVLFSPRKIINEEYTAAQLNNIFPNLRPNASSNTERFYPNPEAKLIAQLLQKYQGNKNSVAKDLNISRSTLWRKIQKYGL